MDVHGQGDHSSPLSIPDRSARPIDDRPFDHRSLVRAERIVVGIAMAILFAKLGGIASPGGGWARWQPWTWRPGPLFRDTLTTGGDTGAHVWTAWFARHHLLPSLHVTGWSEDWYAGLPILQLYFPLPMWLATLLGLVIGANVGFKLVTVLGVLSLPFVVMHLATRAGLPRVYRSLFALGAIAFLLDPHYTILGGNILSTLAGEFSFSISLTAGVLFVGLLLRMYRTGRGRALAAVTFAVTSLSHILPTAFTIVAAAVVLLVDLPTRSGIARVHRVRDTAIAGITGALLAAFWVVPFAAHLPYSNDMGWQTEWDHVGSLFPPLFREHLTGAGLMGGVVVLGVLGGLVQTVRYVTALVRRREPDPSARTGTTLGVLATLSALAFRFPPSARVLNERALPFWFLSCSLLACFGLAALAAAVRSTAARLHRHPRSMRDPRNGVILTGILLWWTFGANLLITPGWLPIPSLRPGHLGVQRADSTDDTNPVPVWAKENYDGYEATDEWPELQGIVAMMRVIGAQHGCGRAMWDYEDEMARYGSEVALMLLPMWTDGCIASMEGMYYESSASVPYHFFNASLLSGKPGDPQAFVPYPGLDVDAGVRRLQQWGVRYYLVFSPAAQVAAARNPSLRLLGSVPYTRDCEPSETSGPTPSCPTTIQAYEVLDAELVQPLTVQPVVVTGIGQGQREGWLDVAMAQYKDPDRHPLPFAAAGPRYWQRVPATFTRDAQTSYGDKVTVAEGTPRLLLDAKVSRIEHRQGSIRFTVSRTGVPVVVKESYFPQWHARGAEGPWRLAPNLMVVIPTEREVTLSIGMDGADRVGVMLTSLGVLALVGLVALERRNVRAQRRAAAPPLDQSSRTGTR